GRAEVAASLSVAAGQGKLSAGNGGSVTILGSGTNAIALRGSLADINAFIAAGHLAFEPPADFHGDVTLGITISDEGHSGSGGSKSSSAATTLAVSAVNDAPSLSLTPLVTALAESANVSGARKVADITVSDVDSGINVLSLSGADADLFAISDGALWLRAGAALDFETNAALD